MLKEFAQYLASVKENKTYEIGGQTYSDNDLVRIEKYTPHPTRITVAGLDSIVKVIRTEAKKLTAPIYIHVDSPDYVNAFTALDGEMDRDYLVIAKSDVPGFRSGFTDYESAIIEFRSKFIPNKDIAYILDLLSRINMENGVTTTDNGVSQSVEARKGISLKQMENIKPRVTLAPYRTFLEVEQPESEFLLRLDDNGRVGLFEADGGMWKLHAKQNIADYFSEEMKSEIADGTVVVMI